jgi:glycine cleavage system regulatory protein
VRAAFRAAVDADLPGEDDSPGDDLDLEEHVDHVVSHLTEAGQAFILVPARAQRIDERIAHIRGDLPAELAQMDKNAEPTPMTAQDALQAAVTATLGGTMAVAEIGDLLRAMSPNMAVHPFASLV